MNKTQKILMYLLLAITAIGGLAFSQVPASASRTQDEISSPQNATQSGTFTGDLPVFGPPQREPAQEPTPTPTPLPDVSTYSTRAQFTFEQLDQPTFSLHHPDAWSFGVSLPTYWTLIDEVSVIQLRYDMELLGQDNAVFDGVIQGDLPFIEVYINDALAEAFTPQPGKNQTISIPFPFRSVRRTDNPFNDYQIRIEYIRGQFCDTETDPVVTVYNDSFLDVTFNRIEPNLDMATYPSPLVQASFIPEKLPIVIPDDYTENDLAAAATIAASLGRSSSGALEVEMMPASQATEVTLANSSAIAVGEPSNNLFIQRLYATGQLPTTLGNEGIVGFGAYTVEDGDGVLQLMRSHINDRNSFLVVSGNTPEGVLLAAKALESPRKPELGLTGTIAVIQDVNPEANLAEENLRTLSFIDLRAGDQTFYGIGRHEVFISFFVPNNWQITDDVILKLAYLHSANLSNSNSIINIEVNNLAAGSAPIDTSIQGTKEIIVPINPADLNPGRRNSIRLEVLMEVDQDCVDYEQRSNWLRVRGDSLLSIPYQLASVSEDAEVLFTEPFYYLTTHPDILFSLPSDPTATELTSLALISYELGAVSSVDSYNIDIAIGQEVDPAVHEDFNIVAIGKPSENATISSVNDVLPQPFLVAEDTLQQTVGNIVYRLPEDYSVGLIEVTATPWNPQRGITAITGTSDEGLAWSLDIYSKGDSFGTFDGDVNYVIGATVEAIQTYQGLLRPIESVISQLGEEAPPLEPITEDATQGELLTGEADEFTPQPTPSQPTTTTYLIYGLIGVGITLLAVGVYNNIRNRQRR
ncbi:MAG: hypothetical protein HND51_05015 [Chloroflexi bacterium]|nr:hypothetical protein [Chloroflexota bacterium]